MDLRFCLLMACFFLSGFAALLYQTAWTRELSFVFGTSDLAVAAVLAAYMGGLALGAAIAARFASTLRRPVLVYGLLELAVGVSALLVPLGIAGVNAAYVSLLGGGSDLPDHASAAGTAVQLLGAFAVLLPPTAFMGATLPLLARYAVRREEEIASRVGILYAINTAGAIAGTLCAAFWLMPEVGLRRTVWSGVALNFVVFGLAALLARGTTPPPDSTAESRAPAADGTRWILPAIAVSGAVSFAYEVLWTRLLGLLLGGSLHAFASMLACFLTGIALGSAIAARVATRRERAVLGFAIAQLGIAATSYAAFALSDQLPDLSRLLGAGPASPLPSAAVGVAALLPITLFIGATFPFAVRVLAARPAQAASATARIYAWNTVGAIAGALGAGFVLLPALGFEGTLVAGVATNLALGVFAALAARPRRPRLAALGAGLGIALALLGARPPWTLLRATPMLDLPIRGDILFSAVGRSSWVMVTDQGAHYRLSSNGLPESGIDRAGALLRTPTTHWMGALPSLLRTRVQDQLVIGLGGAVTLERVPATVERIDVIELEPEVLAANRFLAERRARDPLSDPRVRVRIGDARGSLQLIDKRYDAIVSQPSHPWTAGASHLYTREFFSLLRSRLQPDGVFVQWIGLAFIDEALLRSLLATLLDVFPHVELYMPERGGLLFAASGSPLKSLESAAQVLDANPADFAFLGLHGVEDFASALALDELAVRALAQGADINTDDHNQLASRSAQLGSNSLDWKSLAPLLQPNDPLVRAQGLDRPALIRSLARRGQRDRATTLAEMGDEASSQAALGWLELAMGRAGRASRLFERVLALSPGDRSAQEGLIASMSFELKHSRFVPGISDAEVDPRHAALIEGWGYALAKEWDAVADLDPVLASIEPSEGLFPAASRLRIAQRLATGSVDASREAQSIAETLLLRSWDPNDALLRARAASGAQQPQAAWASLHRIADLIGSSPRAQAVAERALEIAQGLPDEMSGSLRAQLAEIARSARKAGP